MTIRIFHGQTCSGFNHYVHVAKILSQESGLDIQHHHIKREYGKKPTCHAPIHFNLSHTHGQLFIATAPYELGIDVESCQRIIDPNVRARIRPTNEPNLAVSDLEYWVLKEAAIKYTGNGFAHIRQTVCFAPEESMLWYPFTDQISGMSGYALLGQHGSVIWAVACTQPQPIELVACHFNL